MQNAFIHKFLATIDPTKATQLDNIGANILKLSAPFIADSLTRICNLSIQTGVFPEQWKTARVTPLFKKKSRDDPNNYRPISILPVLSQIN